MAAPGANNIQSSTAHLKWCMRLFAACLLLLGFACGCSHQKTLSRDELRSNIKKAISYAAETELFVDFVRQQHSTTHYAEAHPSYLAEEIEDSVKELTQSKADPSDEQTARLLNAALHVLSDALGAVRSSPTDEQTLAVAKARATAVRQRLQEAQAGL